MNSVGAALWLAGVLSFAGAGDAGGNPGVTALLERGSETLAAESLDIDDPWVSARLLARFGENTRAHELLRGWRGSGDLEYGVERFQIRVLTEMGLYEQADSLLALRTHTTDPRRYYLHYLQRSRLNTRFGNYTRALDFIRRLDGLEDFVFEPHRDLVAVEALLRTQRPLEACRVAEARIANGVPSSLGAEFESRLLEGYLNCGQTDRALDLIEHLKQNKANWRLVVPLVVREVEVRFMLGDTLGAIRAAVDLAASEGTGSVAGAVDGVLSRVPVDELSNAALLEFASFLLSRNRTADVERLLAELEKRTLEPVESEKRRLQRSDLLYRKKRYAAAEGEVVDRFAELELERRAKLLRARIYRRMGQPIRAADAYETFAKAFPYDSKAPEALYVAWDLQRDAGNTAKSADLLTRIVETYPTHTYSRLATLRMALDHVDRREYSRGIEILEAALDRTGREDVAFLYHVADIYGKMGKETTKAKVMKEITELNPTSFYLDPDIPPSFTQPVVSSVGAAALYGEAGLLEFLKTVLERRFEAYGRIKSAVGGVDGWDSLEESTEFVVRGREFLEMGFADWAESELRVVESMGKLPARVHLELGALYDDFSVPWRSVRAYQRAYYALAKRSRRALERDFKILMYPTPFPSLVIENCHRWQMSPHLVYAMIREESRFDERAVSRAGAMGLMQIMPETGGEIAEELGIPQEIPRNLLSPEINLTFGIRYASRLLEESDENPLMMLAAYNAGLSNARKWFHGGKSKLSPIERIEGIDYTETREYVKRIVESSHLYHAFYFSP